jgi:hypothetical protein
MPIKGRSRALLQRVGRAEKDGTALSQGRSLPPAWTLVTPYCKRTRPGRGANTKAAGFTSHACLPPAPLPPFSLRLAPTHLGWGTRRQFTHRSRDPLGSKRRHNCYKELVDLISEVLPTGHKMPKDMYQSKKFLEGLGMEYEKIDVCQDKCMLLWKEHGRE